MKLDEDDRLISVHPCAPEDNILMATQQGKAIRFKADAVRVFRGRGSTGVRGIRLLEKDRVVSMSVLTDPENQFILAVTENGYGKRTKADDYRITGRGGQGVANIVTSERNGPVVASFPVTEEQQLMLATDGGTVIRIRVHGQEGDSIRVTGRNTQGVTLFDTGEEEKVASVGLIQESDDDEDDFAGDVEDGPAMPGDVPGQGEASDADAADDTADDAATEDDAAASDAPDSGEAEPDDASDGGES